MDSRAPSSLGRPGHHLIVSRFPSIGVNVRGRHSIVSWRRTEPMCVVTSIALVAASCVRTIMSWSKRVGCPVGDVSGWLVDVRDRLDLVGVQLLGLVAAFAGDAVPGARADASPAALRDGHHVAPARLADHAPTRRVPVSRRSGTQSRCWTPPSGTGDRERSCSWGRSPGPEVECRAASALAHPVIGCLRVSSAPDSIAMVPSRRATDAPERRTRARSVDRGERL